MKTSYRPYAPRPIASHGEIRRAGHRLKLYTIRLGGASLDLDDYREGMELALSELPAAQPGDGRPGLGFLIVHRGRDMDYVVLAWWDRENELPVRVVVREKGPWRLAGRSESFCVWDLEIMAFERDAYVETVLSDHTHGSAAYLDRVWTTPVTADADPSGIVSGISEVVLRVADIDAMRDFYVDVVGLVPWKSSPGFVFLEVVDTDTPLGRGSHPQVVALVDRDEHPWAWPGIDYRRPDPAASSLDHLAFEVRPGTLTSERRRLEGLGLEVEAVEFPGLEARGLFFRDPEGNVVEFLAHAPAEGG